MTRNVRKTTNKPLRFECLENRRLLAFAAFETELLHDNDGIPGEVITDSQVAAGDTFFLRVSAEEFDPQHSGLRSVALDVAWDSALVNVIEQDFELDSVLTSDLPLFQSGTLDAPAGVIHDLSGSAMISWHAGRPIGDSTPETFAIIRMHAGNKPSTSTIDLQSSRLKTTMVPLAILKPEDIRLGSELITIVAAEQEPALPTESGAPPQMAVEEQTDEISATTETQPPALMEPSTPVPPTAGVEAIPPTDFSPEILPPDTSLPTEPAEVEAVEEPVVTPKSTADSNETSAQDTTPNVTPTGEIESAPTTPDASETGSGDSPGDQAAAVDAVLSFDFNGDGVFDLGDLGLMNVHAASAATSSPDAPSIADTGDEAASIEETAGTSPVFLPSCIAIPTLDDAQATEQWLDDFATAWLADSDARASRREESKLF